MLNKLVRGKKYTLLGSDGFLDFKMQINLIDFIYTQYAQYADVPFITFKKKGGRKIHKMYLSYEYSFIDGWQDIKTSKLIEKGKNYELSELIRYKDLKIDNAIVSGKVGTVETNKRYESLIDYSFDIGYKYGIDTEMYNDKFKAKFTELNYSFNNEMIDYYKIHHNYFLDTLRFIEKSS